MHLQEQPDFGLSGSKTCRVRSVRLEKPFWDLLGQMALEAGVDLGHLISLIDEAIRAGDDGRTTSPLSSRLRVACLRWSASKVRTAVSVKAAGRQASVLQTVLDEIGDCSQVGAPNRTPITNQIH